MTVEEMNRIVGKHTTLQHKVEERANMVKALARYASNEDLEEMFNLMLAFTDKTWERVWASQKKK